MKLKDVLLIGLGVLWLRADAMAQCLFTEKQELLASDGAAGDIFGSDTAMHAGTAILGAQYDNNQTGSAYVFNLTPGGWVEQQKLTAFDGAPQDYFARSVDIYEDVIVIGAYRNDAAATDAGSVYVYRFDGATWGLEQQLTASDAAGTDLFGWAVSVWDDVIAVGAFADDDKGSQSGSAYLFRWDGVVWTEEQKVVASDGAATDDFAYDLDLEQDVLLCGAFRDDDKGADSGSAYVFRRVGGVWQEEQKLLASSGAAGDRFGKGVTLEGSVAVCGADWHDLAGLDAGAAFVYRFDGANWQEEQVLVAASTMPGDLFGFQVDVSGATLLVGSPYHDYAATDAGASYVFEYDGTQWVEVSALFASDPGPVDRLGERIVIDGRDVLLVASQHDHLGAESGAVYYFAQDPVLTAVTPSRGKYSGTTSVALTGSGFLCDPSPDVYVRKKQATGVIVVNDNTIICDFPPGTNPGWATVTIVSNGGSSVLQQGYLYTPAVLLSGTYAPGGSITLQYLCDPGDSIYAIYGLPPQYSIPTPPYDGTLSIWPFYKLFLAPSWPLDTWSQIFTIPPDPTLSGLQVLFQGLVGPSFGVPKDAAWTNVGVLDIE